MAKSTTYDSSGTVTETTVTETEPNSIEVSQDAKGIYRFTVKVYFDAVKGDPVADLKGLFGALHQEFPNE